MQEVILKNGVLGAFVIALAIYILRIQSDHKKERKEWKDTMEKQFERMDETTTETNKVMREHTNIISELKGLLKGFK